MKYLIYLAAIFGSSPLFGGPYSAALNEPSNSYDAPIPGFIGPDGIGKARIIGSYDAQDNPVYLNPNNIVNPLFFGWATAVTNYFRADGGTTYNDTSSALGPVSGDNFDIVSLGDLTAAQITAGASPGKITLQLAKPIQNFSGADFVIFENGFTNGTQISAELAYVEVSADGINFIRFPSASLNATAVSQYGTIDPTNVFNLAGKHANAYGNSWGTPFDLSQVNLSQITHIRLVDIPGNGAFKDSAQRSIFDDWPTFGSGGFDLEAVGGISTAMTFAEWPPLQTLAAGDRTAMADPDRDGLKNLLEYAFTRLPWQADSANSQPSCQQVLDNGVARPELRFLRDQRLTDLTYAVQISSTLDSNSWTTIAASTAGGPVLAAAGQSLVITESSVSGIASVGVLREVKLRETGPLVSKRFYRVAISRTP